MKKIVVLFLLFSAVAISANTFQLKFPVKSTVYTQQSGNFWIIDCEFTPTKSLPKQLAIKVDRSHAIKVCNAALKKLYKVESGTISVSGIQNVRSPKYSENKVSFAFKVPKTAVKFSKNKPVAKNPQEAQKIVLKTEKNKSVKSISHPKSSHPMQMPALISDTMLENLELSGYHIRIKNDLIQAIDLYAEDFEKQAKSKDWENLMSVVSILKQVKQFEYKDIIFADSKILESDANDIYNTVKTEHIKLISKIETFLTKEISYQKNNLTKYKKEQETLLSKEKSDFEKESIKNSLDEINSCLRQLDMLQKSIQ